MNTKRLFLSILLSLAIVSVFSQTQPTYEICKWFNNKSAAISVNFDDNLAGQFSYALPIMNEKGIKATFFVITGTAGSQWTQLQSAINQGHEVGSHSVTHPTDLNALSKVQIEQEMKDSHDAILSNLTGQTSLSISWPFGKGGGGNDSIVRRIAKKYYYGARNTTAGTANGDMYTHYQNTWFQAFGRDYYMQSGGVLMSTTTTKQNIGTMITEIIKSNGWFSPYYHAIETGGYNNVTALNFASHMDTIASMKNVVWITTFGNASKYHHERNASAILSATSEDNSKWVLSLTNNLTDNVTFNYPLTIRLTKPAFTIESITQNGTILNFVDDGQTLQFNVIPNSGNIELKKLSTSIVNQINNNSHVQLSRNSNSYVLTFSNLVGEHYSISIFDLTGKKVSSIHNANIDSQNCRFNIDVTVMKSGIYFLRTEGIINTKTFKLIIN